MAVHVTVVHEADESDKQATFGATADYAGDLRCENVGVGEGERGVGGCDGFLLKESSDGENDGQETFSDIQQAFENVRVRGRRDLWIPRLSHCVLRRRCHWLSRHTRCVDGATVAFGCRNTHSAACSRINRPLETCDFPKTWFLLRNTHLICAYSNAGGRFI